MRSFFPVLALALATSGCAQLASNTQGPLQPQSVAGPCQVKPFFLLAYTAEPTTLTVTGAGQTCSLVLLNPDLQVFPSATIVSQPPLHGVAAAALTNGGRSPLITYTPQPGYAGPDRFTVTIEPNDHAIAFAVTVTPTS